MEITNKEPTTEEQLKALEATVNALSIAVNAIVPPGAKIVDGQLYVPYTK